MKSKYIVIVVLAIFTQGSCASQSTVYGLSAENSAVLYQIDKYQANAVAFEVAAVDDVFQILYQLAAVLISHLKLGTDYSPSLLAEGLSGTKASIDNFVDSLLLATGRACYAAEKARNAAKADLDDFFNLVTAVIGVVASGNYTHNQDQFKVVESVARKSLADLIAKLYNAIPTCSYIKDAKTLATIKEYQESSTLGLCHTANVLSNAITQLVKASLSGTKDLAKVISALEDDRDLALIGLRTDVEHKFGVVKAIYLNDQLKQSGITTSLIIDQYSRSAEFYRHQRGVETIFGTIKCYLRRVALKLSDAGTDAFSPADQAQAIATANYKAGLRVLLDTILAIQPNASASAKDAWDFFDAHADKVVEACYHLILSTQIQNSTYPEFLAHVEKIRKTTLVETIEKFASVVFDLIRNKCTYNNKIGEQLATLQKATATAFNDLICYIIEGIIVLAKVSFEIEVVSKDNFAALNTAERKSISSTTDCTYAISGARVIVIQNNYAH